VATEHIYNPRIDDYELPQPILRWEDSYGVDFQTAKVPLQDGVLVFGESDGPCEIRIEGQIHKDTTAEVLEEMESLKSYLRPANSKFDLYRYYDAANDNYIYYPDCRLQRRGLVFPRTNKTMNVQPYTISAFCPSGDVVLREGVSAPTYGYRHFYGELYIHFADSDGTSSFVIRDVGGTALFRVDSLGNVKIKGFVSPGGTPTWP